MGVRVTPGAEVSGVTAVPGDKSIAHRWLILAATARGRSRLRGVPGSLDVRSTASCLAALAPEARPALEDRGTRAAVAAERNGSTWNREAPTLDLEDLRVEGGGRGSLVEATAPLHCGNSGTSMRLLAGLVAGCPFTTTLVGDRSLASRPMERVAVPLRRMGADVGTVEGKPPMTIRGAGLRGIGFEPDVPSAQVKGAVLFAGLGAEGVTVVRERAATRDHTERVLAALGARISWSPGEIVLEGPYEHRGFDGAVPGDASSAAFLAGAAILTGGAVTVPGVGLNPSRLGYLEVLRRMGVVVETDVMEERMGEPVGTLRVVAPDALAPVHVGEAELPLIVDEVPLLAALAVHASGESRFEGAGELRVKESDRLAALAEGIRGLGGHATVEGDGLVVAGGGIAGGSTSGAGDHRIAMALVVGALAARGPSLVEGSEWAAVSFPGFIAALSSLGARIEEAG